MIRLKTRQVNIRTVETMAAPLVPIFLPKRPVVRLLIPGSRIPQRYITELVK